MANKYIFLTFLFAALISIPLIYSLELTINNPEEETTYNNKIVQFNLESDENVLFYYSDTNNSGVWHRLCGEQLTICIKKIRLHEGINQLMFKADNGRGDITNLEEKNIKIDTTKPKIGKTLPEQNSFINEPKFSIIYTEENLKNIKLFYKIDEEINMAEKTDCPSGKNQKCYFEPEELDLNDYNNKFLTYWFQVFDGANLVNSTKTKVKIDIGAPEFTNLIWQQNRNQLKVIIDLNENNLKEITWKDENDCIRSDIDEGVICTVLKNGRCIFTRGFCRGSHSLIINAKDKAGNSQEYAEPIEFTVN